MFRKTMPLAARLMTWDYTANFEETPGETAVRERFREEMPLTMERVAETSSCIGMWLMISFNGSDGRHFRYLAAIPQEHSATKGCRLLPPQISLYAAADRALKSLDGTAGNEGNGLFWKVSFGTLYILVFLEGRLCHWSEEEGYENAKKKRLDSRLERFRQFLEQDDLFSRGKNFIEKELNFGDEESLKTFPMEAFRRAACDPFFRKLDLGAWGRNDLKKKNFVRREPLLKLFFFAALLTCIFIPFKNFDSELKKISDVKPVELLEAPPVEQVDEQREFGLVRTSSVDPCPLPQLSVRGIVGGKLALVSDCPLCKSESLAPLDSVGAFVVREVGRDRLFLSCGEKTVEVTTR